MKDWVSHLFKRLPRVLTIYLMISEYSSIHCNDWVFVYIVPANNTELARGK